MNLLVSTNVYKPGQLARVIPHLHAFRGQIGVELFPMFDADCYEKSLSVSGLANAVCLWLCPKTLNIPV